MSSPVKGDGALTRSVGPKTYFKWDLLQKPYPIGIGCSEEEATMIMQNERDNLDLVSKLVEKHKLDVDFWRGELCESESRRTRCVEASTTADEFSSLLERTNRLEQRT